MPISIINLAIVPFVWARVKEVAKRQQQQEYVKIEEEKKNELKTTHASNVSSSSLS